MAVEDIILRSVINVPLTTKGSQLTWEELDGNFIEIFNAFLSNYLSSYVDAYDNGTTYDNSIKNYVIYSSVIWKFVNATPAVGVTPGTDAARWVRVFAADLAHKKNSDTILAEGTADEVSAADLALLVNNAPIVYTMDKTILASDVLTAYTGDTPIKIVSHSGGINAGKSIKFLSMELENIIESSPASTPYATNLTPVVYTEGAIKTQFAFNNALNATVRRITNGAIQTITSATDTQLIEDTDVYFGISGGNPTAGDYNIRITGTYIYR
jgi:hypothetical protein